MGRQKNDSTLLVKFYKLGVPILILVADLGPFTFTAYYYREAYSFTVYMRSLFCEFILKNYYII